MDKDIQLYVDHIREEFILLKNEEVAKKQTKYMRDKFVFYGLHNPQIKTILKDFLHHNPLTYPQARALIFALYREKQREFHFFANWLWVFYKNQIEVEDIDFIKQQIDTHSWWDSIDVIAPYILGSYCELYPKYKKEIYLKWRKEGKMWLDRSLIIFQLKYKETTDIALLEEIILNYADRKEFFIRKAIGWALREYSKTDENYVINFIEKNRIFLNPLSSREGLKWLKNRKT